VQDLNMPVRIRVKPTIREPDGLAISSRNEYLGEQERRQSVCLYRALVEAQKLYGYGERDPAIIRTAMARIIASTPLAEMDYAEIVDCETLEPVHEVTDRAVAVLAVRVGSTRLIDNARMVDTAYA